MNPPRCIPARHSGSQAFTLIELMVSMTILAILLLVTLGIINQVGKIWQRTTNTSGAFREARAAFETMTRRVSQANLNTYFDYVDASGQSRAQAGASTFQPDRFVRQSELHFVAGQADALLTGVTQSAGDLRPGHALFFQAPLGFTDTPPTGSAQLTNLLNAVGYYVQYSDDSLWRPQFLSSLADKKRFRLMQMIQGTERLSIYDTPLTSANRFNWFRDGLSANPVLARPVADNILILVAWPRAAEEYDNDQRSSDTVTPLTANYAYDTKEYLSAGTDLTRNQLPPMVQITLVAIDELSASRLEELPAASKTLLQPGALFTDSAPAATYWDDLDQLTDFLDSNRINHRVFTSSIVIRQAKFSND